MTAYTEADVAAAAEAIRETVCNCKCGEDSYTIVCSECDARAVLDAVAPAIRKRGWGEGLAEGYNEGWDAALHAAIDEMSPELVDQYVMNWLKSFAAGE